MRQVAGCVFFALMFAYHTIHDDCLSMRAVTSPYFLTGGNERADDGMRPMSSAVRTHMA